MSYTATYNENPTTFPWLQVFLALSASSTVSLTDGHSGAGCDTFSYTVHSAGSALVAVILYECAVDSGETGHYDVSDDGGNAWTLAGEAYINDGDGNLWGLQVWCCTALAAGSITLTTTVPGDLLVGWSSVSEWGAVTAVSLLTSTSGSDTTGVPTLTMDASDPQVLLSIGVVISGGDISSFSRHTPFTANAFSASAGDLAWWVIGEYETFDVVGPPPPPDVPPLRYKKIPLTLDFASTTFDQANRLAMYELYRACGLDPTNAFLQSQFDGLADDRWKPPVGLEITVRADAVDANWAILKKVLDDAGNVQPLCGKRITIDASVSEEWAGDYEVMKATYNPYQSQAGGTSGGSLALAPTVDTAAGTIVLTLRTYSEDVLGLDTSQTPSYDNVPGPILGDEVDGE